MRGLCHTRVTSGRYGGAMEQMKRYAIYYAPPAGPWADWAAAWLGWDAGQGADARHPEVAGLPRDVAELTATPRKYGFHATLKPPFRLADGQSADALHQACAAMAAKTAPVTLDGLRLSRLGGFLALTPEGDVTALGALAARCVADLDSFRAPPTEAEIARRNPAALNAHQGALLDLWGYPWVMDQFRFHMTLTGDVPEAEAEAVRAVLAPIVAPLVPGPLVIDQVCLFGEDAGGRFHILHRYALSA